MKLIFATQNLHKLKEARQILTGMVELISLRELDYDDELPETGTTFESNAMQKAMHVYRKFGIDCFADDSGLSVNALNGAPGVYSARYAGVNARNEDNIAKLLLELRNESRREARFITCIALVLGGKEYYFEGEVKGTIAEEISGVAGFGYDPVFIPDGSTRSFAEMKPEEKNSISHRAQAMHKMAAFLVEQ